MTPKTKLKLAIAKELKTGFPCVVVAFRYKQANDFYIVGQVCDPITAQRLAFDETDLRGGKYTCKAINMGHDFDTQWEEILKSLGPQHE